MTRALLQEKMHERRLSDEHYQTSKDLILFFLSQNILKENLDQENVSQNFKPCL